MSSIHADHKSIVKGNYSNIVDGTISLGSGLSISLVAAGSMYHYADGIYNSSDKSIYNIAVNNIVSSTKKGNMYMQTDVGKISISAKIGAVDLMANVGKTTIGGTLIEMDALTKIDMNRKMPIPSEPYILDMEVLKPS
jgi:hypothetical protein